jgi:hypothetical protein
MKKSIFIFFLLCCSRQLSAQVDKVVVKLADNATLVFERASFDSTGKKIERRDDKIIAIDGRPVLGTDGELPRYILKKATLITPGNKYDLQVDNMYNPWFGETPDEKLIKTVKSLNDLKLRCVFSEDAAAYAVEWWMVGQSSIRTVLTKDKSIVLQYSNN